MPARNLLALLAGEPKPIELGHVLPCRFMFSDLDYVLVRPVEAGWCVDTENGVLILETYEEVRKLIRKTFQLKMLADSELFK